MAFLSARQKRRAAKKKESKGKKGLKSVLSKLKEGIQKGKASKAKKKEGKAWTKAVKAQKKTGGATMNELIKARNAAKASGDTAAYAKAQNQINKAYGSKKVHKADAPKKTVKKKVAAKPDVRKVVKNLAKSKAKKPKAPEFTEADVARHKENLRKHREAMDKDSAAKAKPKKKKKIIEPYPPREDQGPKFMKEGGKVESNPFGWPSSDSRKR